MNNKIFMQTLRNRIPAPYLPSRYMRPKKREWALEWHFCLVLVLFIMVAA